MGYFDDELYEEIDREEEELEEDEETLEELDVDENGHVVEGRRNRRRSRDDEYEPDFDEAEMYGYDDSEPSED